MSSDWIPVGRLTRSRGNRGELLGEIYSTKPGRAEQLNVVVLDVQGRRREATVEKVWHHSGVPVFKFAGIDTISQADEWAGADILVPPEEKAPLEEGEYSFVDLEGCAVVDGDRKVGVVQRVDELGGRLLLAVKDPEGHEFLIPFVKAICKEIDVAGKVIRVELPEGLLDL